MHLPWARMSRSKSTDIVSARLVHTYAEVERGSACALFGSTEHLEIAVNGGSAAARFEVSRGASVVVRL